MNNKTIKKIENSTIDPPKKKKKRSCGAAGLSAGTLAPHLYMINSFFLFRSPLTSHPLTDIFCVLDSTPLQLLSMHCLVSFPLLLLLVI
jgi:hypothetical protein